MFLNIDFSNDWWYSRFGISSSKDVYMDIVQKLKNQLRMEEILNDMFGLDKLNSVKMDMGVSSSPKIGVEPFGHRFIPAMFGCSVLYSNNQPPWAEHNIISSEEIMDMPLMTLDEFSEHPNVKLIVSQAQEAKVGGFTVSCQQNLGSVINTAIYLRGMELFYDYYSNPEVIEKLYMLITNMMLNSYDYFSMIDRRKSALGIGNCSVTMLSPFIYSKFNYKYDRMIMEKAREENVDFSLHQDSKLDAFIECYTGFDYLVSFDIGCDTDVAKFRRAFPNIIINDFIYTNVLGSYSNDELAEFVKKTVKDAGSADKLGFSAFDIDCSISDEKIYFLCDLVKAYV